MSNPSIVHTSYDVGRQVVGAVVRSAVYHSEGRIFSHMSTPAVIVVTIVIIAVACLWSKRR
jgi:sugar phosphate permease